MKAVLFATALAISAILSRATEEPIEFAGPARELIHALEGRNGAFESTLIRGTNVRFQWFHSVQGNPNGWRTNALPGQTNITLNFTPFETFDYGSYYLLATNAMSSAQKEFVLYTEGAPRFSQWNQGGWLGVEGESFNLNPQVQGVSGIQWFHNGNPTTSDGDPLLINRILTPQTAGSYWFTGTNSVGELFTSPTFLARIKPITDINPRFRSVEPLNAFPGADPITSWNATVHEDGAITMSSDRELYRWKSGVTEKFLATTAEPPGFEGLDWYIRNIGAEETFADLLIVQRAGPKAAVVRKSAAGYQTAAETGFTLRGGAAAVAFSGLKRAAAKTAFWGWHSNNWNAVSILVFDGQQTSEWFNSKTDFVEPFRSFGASVDPGRQFGFDGQIAAFVGEDFGPTRHHGVFTVNSAHEVKPVALRGDSIPGTPYNLAGLHRESLAVQSGRVLFRANIWQNFMRSCLVEYDPDRENRLKIIAMEGDVVENDYALGFMSPLFGYLSDGSIVFEAGTGRFRPDTAYGSSGGFIVGIYQYKDGIITHQIDGRERIGGQQLSFLSLSDVGGTNTFVSTSLGMFTTAPAAERAADDRVTTTATPDGVRAEWSGSGWLQSSGDLIHWQRLLSAPGVITNQVSTNAQFFRVFYP